MFVYLGRETVRSGKRDATLKGLGTRRGRLPDPEDFDVAVLTTNRDPHLPLSTPAMSMGKPLTPFVDERQFYPDLGVGPGFDPLTRWPECQLIDVNHAVALIVAKVRPEDPHALAEAIIRLLKNPKLREKMGAHARKHVEDNFTIERMAERTAAAYERCIKRQ